MNETAIVHRIKPSFPRRAVGRLLRPLLGPLLERAIRRRAMFESPSHARSVERLLWWGADPNRPMKSGFTLLAAIALLDDEQACALARSMLAAGADPNKPCLAKWMAVEQTALHLGARMGRPVFCETLIRAGASLDALDGQGHSALQVALGASDDFAVNFKTLVGDDVEGIAQRRRAFAARLARVALESAMAPQKGLRSKPAARL